MRRFIPTKFFLKKFFIIAGPIILQQIFINSAIVIDNLMVGQLGRDSIMAIGAANGISLIFTFAMFGAASGSGIFVSQYNGAKNKQGILDAASIKTKAMLIHGISSIIIVWIFAPQLISLFIKDLPENAIAFKLSVTYLKIFIVSQFFKSLNYGFSTSFQQVGKPMLGLKASSVSVITNIVLNYFLIFGYGPFPKMGLIGAGIGTVLSKVASFSMWMFVLNTKSITSNMWNMFKKTNATLRKKIIQKTIPLFTNELFWSIGMSIRLMIIASYGGIQLAAMGIQQNINTIVNVIWASISGATIYLVGKKLGSGELEHAKERAMQMITVTFFLGISMALLLYFTAPPLLNLYKVGPEIKTAAISLIRVFAIWYPLWMPIGAMFFILRVGGRVKEILILDLFSIYFMYIPVLILAKVLLKWNVDYIILLATTTDFIKLAIAIHFFRKGKWLTNLVKN